MQVCTDCNHPLDTGDQFCSHCGTSVERVERTVALAAAGVAAASGPGGGGVSSDRAGSALGSLESMLSADTSDAGRLTFAAFQRLCDGEIEDALLAAESAVTMNPRLWSAHLIAGVSRNQRGETEQAEAHLHDALQAEPMVVHHKGALERMLASRLPKRRAGLTPPAWMTSLTPGAWAMIVGIPVLFVGLMVIAMNGGRKNDFEHNNRPQYTNAAPTNPSPTNPTVNAAYPTPVPPSASPTYSVPPPTSSYTPPPVVARSSPSTPNTYSGGTPNVSVQPQRSGPGPLPAGRETPMMEPLPPAQPNVSGIPELDVRPHGSGSVGNVASSGTPQDATPWNKSNPKDQNRATVGVSLGGNGTGHAVVGSTPATSTRSNLPPPSDAITSSSRVAPAPALPQRSSASTTGSSSGEGRSQGRELQSSARRLQNQGRSAEAAQAYRDAISAYQDDINSGRNPRSAEYGMAASKAALDLLESGQ